MEDGLRWLLFIHSSPICEFAYAPKFVWAPQTDPHGRAFVDTQSGGQFGPRTPTPTLLDEAHKAALGPVVSPSHCGQGPGCRPCGPSLLAFVCFCVCVCVGGG